MSKKKSDSTFLGQREYLFFFFIFREDFGYPLININILLLFKKKLKTYFTVDIKCLLPFLFPNLKCDSSLLNASNYIKIALGINTLLAKPLNNV